jgi:murein DD-endopeptidase MepM/ murein hydrolase activator NlpD
MVRLAGVGAAKQSSARPGLVPYYSLSRSVALTAACILALSTAWAGGATLLLLFRDDFVATLVARQTEMQYAYEDRLGALRARVDRLTSRQLLEQDGVEVRMAELLSRQVELETRQSIIANIAEQARLPAALARARKPDLSVGAVGGPEVPSPVMQRANKPSVLIDALDATSSMQKSPPRVDAPLRKAGTIEEKLSSADRTMGSLEVSQLTAVNTLAETAKDDATRLQSIVLDVGLGPVKAAGGPFVPLKLDPKAGPFEQKADALQTAVLSLARVRDVVDKLPLARPMRGDMDVTSSFGVRPDPFTRRPAMHTGIDMKADQGAPVRATAPGVVTAAEYSGGYGNMVEIDHGNGVVTRYGHLASIAVEDGQNVQAGVVVGRVGSTGRATGPHLHYETRLGGDAVDPQRFLKAGTKLSLVD